MKGWMMMIHLCGSQVNIKMEILKWKVGRGIDSQILQPSGGKY